LAVDTSISSYTAFFGFVTLSLGYALFLLLLTKLRRVERQKQICSLSKELNGNFIQN
jgi:hypothetical protein